MADELFEDYKKNPTIEKRNALVEKNLYMVDYDDLYQIGALALVSAVERFDPMKGFEFSSFATPTILGEIKKYFRDKQWSLKVPRRLKEIAAKVQDAKEVLTSQNHRAPTVEELARQTGFTEEQIIEHWTARAPTVLIRSTRRLTMPARTGIMLFSKNTPASAKRATTAWKRRR